MEPNGGWTPTNALPMRFPDDDDAKWTAMEISLSDDDVPPPRLVRSDSQASAPDPPPPLVAQAMVPLPAGPPGCYFNLTWRDFFMMNPRAFDAPPMIVRALKGYVALRAPERKPTREWKRELQRDNGRPPRQAPASQGRGGRGKWR
jgi:hypothetical protein